MEGGSSDNLKELEDISLEELDAAFDELANQAPAEPVPRNEVLEGPSHVYDFRELEQVEHGLVPLGFDSEVSVIGEGTDGGSWDIKALMSLNSITST
jgi:hypothetical protein